MIDTYRVATTAVAAVGCLLILEMQKRHIADVRKIAEHAAKTAEHAAADAASCRVLVEALATPAPRIAGDTLN